MTTKLKLTLAGEEIIVSVDHSNNWGIEEGNIPDKARGRLLEMLKRAGQARPRKGPAGYYPGPSVKYASMAITHLSGIFFEAPIEMIVGEESGGESEQPNRVY